MRKAAGLTQKELGKKAGVSQSLIARIENGTVDPRLSTLRRIVQALHPQVETKTASDVMHSPVATISAQDTVRRAVDIMKERGYSQLPVLIDGRVVGSVQEATLLERVAKSSSPIAVLNGTVYNVMDRALETVQLNTSLSEVIERLSSGEPAVLVMKEGSICGIIAKIDVIALSLSSVAGL
jgi:predicted transcriptional regulator